MNADRLLSTWLRNHQVDRARKATEASAEHSVIKDKTTPYAKAIGELARVHAEAAAIYARALAKVETERTKAS